MTPVVNDDSSPTITIAAEYHRIKLCFRKAKIATSPAMECIIKDAKSSQRKILYHISTIAKYEGSEGLTFSIFAI